jgi:hypothetical protein
MEKIAICLTCVSLTLWSDLANMNENAKTSIPEKSGIFDGQPRQENFIGTTGQFSDMY